MLGRAQGRDRIDKLKMRYGWKTGEERHSAYICTDGLRVKVASRAFKRGLFVDRFGSKRQVIPINIVKYEIDRQSKRAYVYLFVSGTMFTRNTLGLILGAENIRTVIFPSTVRGTTRSAFARCLFLRSAVMNEGLRQLGECVDKIWTSSRNNYL